MRSARYSLKCDPSMMDILNLNVIQSRLSWFANCVHSVPILLFLISSISPIGVCVCSCCMDVFVYFIIENCVVRDGLRNSDMVNKERKCIWYYEFSRIRYLMSSTITWFANAHCHFHTLCFSFAHRKSIEGKWWWWVVIILINI